MSDLLELLTKIKDEVERETGFTFVVKQRPEVHARTIGFQVQFGFYSTVHELELADAISPEGVILYHAERAYNNLVNHLTNWPQAGVNPIPSFAHLRENITP